MIKSFGLFKFQLSESVTAPLSDLDGGAYTNFKAGDVTKSDRVTKALLDDIERAAREAGVHVLATTAITDHKGIHDDYSRHNKGQALDLAQIGRASTPHSKLPGSGGGTRSNYKKKQEAGSEFFEAADSLVDALIKLGYKLITQDPDLRSKYSGSIVSSESGEKVIIWKYDSERAGNHFNHIHISNNSAKASTELAATLPGPRPIGVSGAVSNETEFLIDGPFINMFVDALKNKNFSLTGPKPKESDEPSQTPEPTDQAGLPPGIPQLSQNMGLGNNFSESDNQQYSKYKTNPKVHWAVYNIDKREFVQKSSNSNDSIYAASVSKAVTAACAVNKWNAKFPEPGDLDKLKAFLVNSDNGVWDHFTDLAGGSEKVNSWSNSMGWGMSPGRRKGNSISAQGMCLFWADVLNKRFSGAELIEKMSNSCKTSSSRSRKYVPTNCRIGGKTGLYEQYMHDSAWIVSPKGRFSIVVLTELASAEAVALMFGGLFREYCE
jgi:hypothetical protein